MDAEMPQGFNTTLNAAKGALGFKQQTAASSYHVPTIHTMRKLFRGPRD